MIRRKLITILFVLVAMLATGAVLPACGGMGIPTSMQGAKDMATYEASKAAADKMGSPETATKIKAGIDAAYEERKADKITPEDFKKKIAVAFVSGGVEVPDAAKGALKAAGIDLEAAAGAGGGGAEGGGDAAGGGGS